MLRVICRIRASLSPKTLIPFPSSLSSSHLPARHRHRVADSDSDNRDPDRPPKLFVVQPRLRPDALLKSKLDEALNLANSLQDQRDDDTPRESSKYVVVQNPAAKSARADRYFGKGTVETVKCHLNAGHTKDGFDAVFVNTILTGIQQRNLEHDWEKPVLDRVGLIIEIFNAHAQTKEGRLQAELAALMHNRSRLVRVRGPGGRYTFGSTGEVEVVSARGRGSGGRGFISGAGETELELQRQRILQRRMQLLSEIKEVRRTRALQRASRKRHGSTDGKGMATVAVVGYTNAGKSTLVSSLSNSNLYCDDRLFATVDPKLRSVVLPSGRKVFLSDTVGFISELPVQLVEAFRATLEEVVEADLLVHVLDSSAPDINEHRETVIQVLEQLGVSEEKLGNMIEVWNKIDIGEEGMGVDEYSEEIEDNDESEQLSEEDLGNECDNDDGNIECEQSHGGHEETRNDEERNSINDWLALGFGKEKETWDSEDGSSFNAPSNCSLKPYRIPDEDPECQTESVPHVKTSAITGVGLQELLELIDERLSAKDIVRRIDKQDLLNQKWRPPRTDETGTSVDPCNEFA